METTCLGCGAGITTPDRFCRNCGAPAAASFGDSVDTSRFNAENGPQPGVRAASSDLTNPFYVPPSSASLAEQHSGALYKTASFLKNMLHRKLVWLGILLLLSLTIPIGMSVGRTVVRANRAERAERRLEEARAKREMEARKAEIAQQALKHAVQNALGFTPSTISEGEYPGIQGIFVNSLTSDYSPAALANIQAGDVLTQLNGQEVKKDADLAQILNALKPGADTQVRVYRDGRNIDSRMRIGDKSVPPLQPKIEQRDQGFLGIGNSIRRCCAPGGKWGLEIRRLVDNSPADLAGLQLGDLITEFDKYPTLTPDEFARRIHLAKPRTKIKIKYYRGAVEQIAELTLGHGW